MGRSDRVSLSDAAHQAGVPVGTVRNWRYRGWLDDEGVRHFLDVNEDGYLIGDVLKAERDTRRNVKSHRRLETELAVA